MDWEGSSGEIARQADALFGGEISALIPDESAFAKKGTAFAGVARQWNGRLGKVENARVGVFAALCRGRRVTLLDCCLYLPRSWTEDEKRCQRARIPQAAHRPRSKCALALELVDAAIRHEVRFGPVVVDGGYGKDPAFLRALEGCSLCFVADVHKAQRIWLSDPEPTLPQARGRRRPAKKPHTDQPSQTAEQWAAQQPASAWRRISLHRDEQGALQTEYLHAYLWGSSEKFRASRRPGGPVRESTTQVVDSAEALGNRIFECQA